VWGKPKKQGIGRCIDVIGIFTNRNAIPYVVGTVLAEQHDE
jgi:hypothetical protein